MNKFTSSLCKYKHRVDLFNWPDIANNLCLEKKKKEKRFQKEVKARFMPIALVTPPCIFNGNLNRFPYTFYKNCINFQK